MNFDFEIVAERVDDRRADPMQSARNFVRTLFELTAGVQHRMHDFQRRSLFRRMHIDRNSTAVVLDRDPIVAQNYDVDLVAETGQRLVNRVVDDLGNEMMQAPLGGIADVHSGAFANRFESLENLDGLSAVAVRRLFICHRKERAMHHLSASPPPVRIVFVYGNKVKEKAGVCREIKQDLRTAYVDRKPANQRAFSHRSNRRFMRDLLKQFGAHNRTSFCEIGYPQIVSKKRSKSKRFSHSQAR